MAITDLTGTKWLLNETLSILKNSSYELNFISNSETYAGISFVFMTNPPPNPPLIQLLYVGSISTLEAFSNSLPGWFNEVYRTIQITGGTDVTNSDLIAWLQENATQIQDESNPISFGNLPIANMYFGTQQVKKVYLGNTLVWEKEETIIEFGIGTSSYQAEEGMTWGEWVNSAYNTGGFKNIDDGIFASNPLYYVVNGENPVVSSDTIIANTNYLTRTGGG